MIQGQAQPYRPVFPPRDPDVTEVIEIPPAAIDPFPPPRQPHGRRRAGRRAVAAVQALAVAAVATVAFVAGQVSVRTGAVPPPPLPASAASVATAAQMTRIWPAMAPQDVTAQCDPWRRGKWREYVTDQWVAHLRTPAGGGIDVDRATVARFLDRACARHARGE